MSIGPVRNLILLTPMRTLLLLFILSALCTTAAAQTPQSITIKGTVRDATKGTPMPAVSIGLLRGHRGTITDDAGQFAITLNAAATSDSVRFSFIGYAMRTYAVSDLMKAPTDIALKQEAYLLAEAVVRPLRPEDYVRLAVRRIPRNHATAPVRATGYYYELITENDVFLRFDEAVTDSYMPSLKDTVKGHSAILHARSAKDVGTLQFMQRTMARKEKRAKKRDKDYEPLFDSTMTSEGLGGPSDILGMDPLRDLPEFLDTNQFKHIRFAWEGLTMHAGRQLLIISFAQRRKLDHMKASGRLYLDADSYAFVGLEYDGKFIIPLLIKPLISMAAGLSIDNPTFHIRTRYREHDGVWHMASAHQDIRIKMSTTALFQKNEHCDLFIEQGFVVNDMQVNNALPIRKERRYDSEKPMTSQAEHNDPGFWDNFNPVHPGRLQELID